MALLVLPAASLPGNPVSEAAFAQLSEAYALLREGKLEAASRAFEKLGAQDSLPPHLRWEARERLREIDRQARGLPARDPAENRFAVPVLPEPARILHVAPGGDDANPGDAGQPFASLERARDEIRRLKAAGQFAPGGVAVWVHDGEFAVRQTFALEKEDSGTRDAPVVYRAAPGASPRFRGGVRLSGFTVAGDPAELDRLPAGARGKVVRLDLGMQGWTNLLELKLGGFASGHGFTTHPAHELFFEGRAMQLARGPNRGFLHIKDVAVKDGTKGYDREGSKVGQIHYEGDLPAGWVQEPDLLLYGYWFWDWADSYERVAAIDPARRLITLAEPYHRYGYSVGAPFYAINALCELDQPGEWYLDRRSRVLFLYPPSDPGEAVIELSRLAEPMLALNDVSHVRFENLTWELGSADAVHVSGGEQCLFAGCTLRHFAGNALTLQGGRAHAVLSCDLYSMGRGGLIVSGGDRKRLEPGGQVIENCDVHTLSRIDHTYTPAVLLSGVGNRVAHNRLHDIASSALRVGGNDHLIELNEVFHAVLESDDQGAADMFGNATYRGNVYRYNHWHHIGTPYGPLAAPSKLGQAGIRLDDAISGTLIYGNVFQRSSSGRRGFGGVQIHGGKDNFIDNNIFAEGAMAVSFSPWSETRWQDFVRDALGDRAIDAALYKARYPELAELAEHANTNRVWRSLVVRCGAFTTHAPDHRIERVGNVVLDQGQLELKADNPLFQQPAFAPIPFEEIGLYVDAYRKRLPTR